MIHGIGTDCQGIAETRQSLQQFGERYLRRVFAPWELAGLGRAENLTEQQIRRLAGLFAAKEAVFRALRPPADLEGGWSQIDIGAKIERSDVCLSGAIRRWSDKMKVDRIRLSLCSTGGFTLVLAIAETSATALTEGKSPKPRPEATSLLI